MHAPQIFLRRDLCLPLEGRERLRHEIGRRQIDGQAALFVDRIRLPFLNDLIGQLRNADDVLVRLGRQAQHEIELHAVPPAGKRRAASCNSGGYEKSRRIRRSNIINVAKILIFIH